MSTSSDIDLIRRPIRTRRIKLGATRVRQRGGHLIGLAGAHCAGRKTALMADSDCGAAAFAAAVGPPFPCGSSCQQGLVSSGPDRQAVADGNGGGRLRIECRSTPKPSIYGNKALDGQFRTLPGPTSTRRGSLARFNSAGSLDGFRLSIFRSPSGRPHHGLRSWSPAIETGSAHGRNTVSSRPTGGEQAGRRWPPPSAGQEERPVHDARRMRNGAAISCTRRRSEAGAER